MWPKIYTKFLSLNSLPIQIVYILQSPAGISATPWSTCGPTWCPSRLLSPLNSYHTCIASTTYIKFLQVHTILLKCIHLFRLFVLFLILMTFILNYLPFFFFYQKTCFRLFWTPHFPPQHFSLKILNYTESWSNCVVTEYPYIHYLIYN